MPSDPVTWTALKATLANWLNRDDLSTAEIPEAIALAERRFQRTLFTPDREAEATLTAAAEAVTLPADLWGIRAAFVDADPKVVLEPMSLNQLRETWRAAAAGRPQNYAIRGGIMLLGPSPDASCSIRLTYIQTIPALGAGQATNWLLTAHPDAYLHGSLAELHLLLADEQRAGFHAARFEEIEAEINRVGRARSHGGAPQRIRAPQVV